MHTRPAALSLPSPGPLQARRLLKLLTLALAATAALLLGGCAGLNTIQAEVSSFSRWPAGRAPGSFAFDRLPSQQSPDQDTLEAAARSALEGAGFKSASSATTADVLVQVSGGSSISGIVRDGRDGPYWWGGAAWGRGFWGPGFGVGVHFDTPVYEHRVDLVLRDRRSHEVLYETHARHERVGTQLYGVLLQPLLRASLDGFPTPPPGGRNVSVTLPSSP